MSYPRVEWDDEVNTAYISMREAGEGECAKQIPVEDENGDVIAVLDFSSGGELLGIEILNAKEQLPKTLRGC